MKEKPYLIGTSNNKVLINIKLKKGVKWMSLHCAVGYK